MIVIKPIDNIDGIDSGARLKVCSIMSHVSNIAKLPDMRENIQCCRFVFLDNSKVIASPTIAPAIPPTGFCPIISNAR